MHVGVRQAKRELEYAKYQLSSLISLVLYEDTHMLTLNKNRALSSIECIIEVMEELKELVESIND
ncbi:hypothetical protein GKG47_09100 [Lactonifactor sp. BIOML-A3]|uniref:hypothetical protein n=1 Tax=unclassified Lactonifactor TaxID=2636670 RepID=UPI0012B08F29|nr:MULTISPECIES: hypothetical protein [unclassified Lactonifactor]MSA02195.1 hypothetical protein [Lactonifactor sp. BIOML-A5]MSA07980.1 hypothetical protein [Lactonifactor sp. BIOML-A4]MSA12596.1 hypothetical protein [Lactonifactor sp. BIOML-A3]MSA16703.1 hypothetical protein [Lactonifactor sp. BIOML-A2]MSA37598.1 hypothetical protein [Lactonifactor sp. BIOML-A1]